MSKKRSKNARAKAVKKKARTTSRQPSERPDPRRQTSRAKELDRQLKADFVELEVAKEQPVGGGAFGAMRDSMTRREEGPDAAVLYKRRSFGELTLWIGVPVVILGLMLKFYGS